ncbi:MAG: adenosylcobinamide-GDP ribazoletransferase [Desulfovibrio sp.]|uniref:adenosylcobinamide-GDP ribazoletransferase n=1 Tax=Desulfovibrio sp. 7SRBS1 TaxID=3378064 RepID=UPI003B3E0AF6
MKLKSAFSDFLTAMTFMTRLVPWQYGTSSLPRTLPYFPLVGVIIGAICVLPQYWGLFSNHPMVQGWLYVCLGIYITRGLHADGLADVADGWGSNATGPRFWEIVKDSRIGAFGVLALVLGLGGQALLAGAVFSDHAFGTAFFSLLLGRQAGIFMCRAGRSITRKQGMGRDFLRAATNPVVALTSIVTLVIGLFCMPFGALVIATLLTLVGVRVLYSLGNRQGGVNGDFIGASIVWGELSALLGYLIF